MDGTELEGWQRVGHTVRRARIDIGFTNRENFAEACGVSVRVLSDLESGTRSNFSERVLSRLEEGLGWAPGTMEQLVSDPSFEPPTPSTGGDLIFRPPHFERRPVVVDVALIERGIAALTDVSRQRTAKSARNEAEQRLGSALASLCWPYVVRLVEDNCLPGNELHPAVRPMFEAFSTLAEEFGSSDPSGRYTRWLAGDAPETPDAVRQRYLNRWSESRRVSRGRRGAGEAEED